MNSSDALSGENQLSPKMVRTLRLILQVGLIAGFALPVLTAGYVFVRVKLADQVETTPESLSGVLTASLWMLLILPAAMILASVIAFIAGLVARHPFWLNLKRALLYLVALPRALFGGWVNSGI